MAQVLNMSNGSAQSSSGTNFAAGGQDVLRTLLQQLLGGGTAEQRAERAARLEEINAVRQQRGDYTKEAAFIDAEAVSARESRLALEKLVPSLTRAAEGAGTSASSMRALLLQDAAAKAAESAAALGLQTATNYGNISASLSGVLANLTQPNNPVTQALLDAISLSKGQTSTSSGDSKTSSNNSGGGMVAGQVGLSPSQTGWAGTGINSFTPSAPIGGLMGTTSAYGWNSKPSNAAQRVTSNALSLVNWSDFGDAVDSRINSNNNSKSSVSNSWDAYQF